MQASSPTIARRPWQLAARARRRQAAGLTLDQPLITCAGMAQLEKFMQSITEIRAGRAIDQVINIPAAAQSELPLADRALRAFSELSVATVASKADVMRRLKSPGLTAPEELQAIQEIVSADALEISTISTVVRKVTATVEGVVRS